MLSKQKVNRDESSQTTPKIQCQRLITKNLPKYVMRLTRQDILSNVYWHKRRKARVLDFRGYDEEKTWDGHRDVSSTILSLEKLARAMKSVRTVKELSIYCQECDELEDKNLKCLAQAIKGFKMLKRVKFVFPDCSQLSHKGIKNIVRGLKSLTFLKRVEIDFSSCDAFNSLDGNICDWGELFKPLKSLTNISLNIAGKTTEEDVYTLGEGLKYSKSLETLSLLSRIGFLNWESLDVLRNSLNPLKTLKSLNLNIALFQSSLKPLAQVLKDLKLLESLSLRICPDDEHIVEIAAGIAEMKSLKNFHFDFNRDAGVLSDNGIKRFFDFCKRLTSLETLDLDLCSMSIGDQGMKSLSLALQELRSLQKIRLNLKLCENLNDNNLQYLFNNNNPFKSLTKLNISLVSCSKITSQGVKSIHEFLKRIPSLEELDLSSEEIDRNFIKEMEKTVECLPNLRKITFRRYNGYPVKEFEKQVIRLAKVKKMKVFSGRNLILSNY